MMVTVFRDAQAVIYIDYMERDKRLQGSSTMTTTLQTFWRVKEIGA